MVWYPYLLETSTHISPPSMSCRKTPGAMWIVLGFFYHWCLGRCLGHCDRTIGFIVWTATGGLFLQLRKWRMSRRQEFTIFYVWKKWLVVVLWRLDKTSEKNVESMNLSTRFLKKKTMGWFRTCFASLKPPKCVFSPKKNWCQEDVLGCVLTGPLGGDMDAAFQYEEQAAVCTEQSYPYTAKNGQCHASACTVGIPDHGVTGGCFQKKGMFPPKLDGL